MHLAAKDDETMKATSASVRKALVAFPFTVTHVLTDRGSCFTADGFERTCRKLKVQHRMAKPTRPRPIALSSASTDAGRARC
ncbi:DDE-type integrase/transposase/recombinase [Microvirga massiliensis]|uniref:DDE-type integrase/transposase/recombinase n=1 Tax=Microvirga massiliensis TaxID=1033741 RepID=UPI00093E3B2D